MTKSSIKTLPEIKIWIKYNDNTNMCGDREKEEKRSMGVSVWLRMSFRCQHTLILFLVTSGLQLQGNLIASIRQESSFPILFILPSCTLQTVQRCPNVLVCLGQEGLSRTWAFDAKAKKVLGKPISQSPQESSNLAVYANKAILILCLQLRKKNYAI